MPSNEWKRTLRLEDVFHNEDMTFEERRDAIVARIKELPNFDAENIDLGEIVDNLAEADDLNVFDNWWDAFYDWADDNRVWVQTRF